jgi:catechol 2,3-dioxygenase-like lactoylglutathione lyase family enzyme
MKRLHVHIAVEDLQKSIAFYSSLFAAEPIVEKGDYAKWMLDDPRVNFAISTRAKRPGLDHVGIQVDEAHELDAIRERLEAAQLPVEAQAGAECCYARSDKYWSVDPQGIAWEAFHSLEQIPVFGAAQEGENDAACCAPSSSCCS